MPDGLTIAVPKGRVLKQLIPRLKSAGIDTTSLTKESRALIRRDNHLSFMLLKPDDVPTYVEYGAADVGIVGRDVLLERDYDLLVPADLGIGRCKMMVCADSPELRLPRTEAGRFALQPSSPTSRLVSFARVVRASKLFLCRGRSNLPRSPVLPM